jgi:predicted nucleic acid-binding protein
MSGLVLDASVVLALVLQETNRRHAAEVMAGVAEHGATVPSLWHIAVGNALLMAERRKLISAGEKSAALRGLSLRLGLALATFDTALQKAARSANVALL